MGPIDQLKAGIESGDWNKVCGAYKGLTGKALNPPAISIKKADTASISELYNDITKLFQSYQVLKADIEEVVEPKKVGRPKKVTAKTLKKEKKDKPTKVEPDELDDLVDDSEIKAGPKGGLLTGSVNAKQNKMRFVTSDLVDEKEAAVNAKAFEASAKIKNKIKKPPRKEKMIPCMFCGKKFDSNLPRNQIGAKFDTGDKYEVKTKCQHCQKHQIKAETEE